MRSLTACFFLVLAWCAMAASASASCGGLGPEQAFARAQEIDQQRRFSTSAQLNRDYLACLGTAEMSPVFGAFAVTLQSRELRLAHRADEALQVLARYPTTHDMPEARADFFRELLEVARGEQEDGRDTRSCAAAQVAFRSFGPVLANYRDSVDPLLAACGVSDDMPNWPGLVTGGVSIHSFLEAALAQGGVPCGLLFFAFRTAPGDAALQGRDPEALMRQCRFGGIMLGAAASNTPVVRVDGKEWRTERGRVLGVQESERVAVQIPSSRAGQRAEQRVYRVASGTIEQRVVSTDAPTTLRVRVTGGQQADVWVNGQLAGRTEQMMTVQPGSVTVSARIPGRSEQSRSVSLQPGESTDIELPRLTLDMSAQCRGVDRLPMAAGRIDAALTATSDRTSDGRPVALYRVMLKPGSTTNVRMTGKGLGDPYLFVLDPSACTTLMENDDGGGGRAAALSIEGRSNRSLLLLATATQTSALGGYQLVVEDTLIAASPQPSERRSTSPPSSGGDLVPERADLGDRAGLFLLFGAVSAASGYGAYEAFSLSYDQSQRYEAIERLPEAVEGQDPPGCDDLEDPDASRICSDSHGNAALGVLASVVSLLSGMAAINQLMDPVAPADGGTKQAEAGQTGSLTGGVQVRPMPFPNGIGVSVKF